MPSIWKAFSRPKAELYQFPEASGLPEEGRDDSFEPLGAEAEALEQEMRGLAREAPEPQPPEPEPEPEPDPIEFGGGNPGKGSGGGHGSGRGNL